MSLPAIKRILGNRVVIRRVPAVENQVLRKPANGDIVAPDGPDAREPHFEAIVLATGEKLSENIRIGDRVICGAHRSQSRVGTRRVRWQGEQVSELISVLDVVMIVNADVSDRRDNPKA